MEKKWHILTPDPEAVKKICIELNCSPVTASILVNRGITSKTVASEFINPSFEGMRPPFIMADMDKAVERIYAAVSGKEKILIFGDYDVDGITATTILYSFFQYIGADVYYYIPHRMDEGYGLQPFHILNDAAPDGINLIITADCGSGSHEAVEAALDAGIDVIITDHHNISDDIPKAIAVINPKRKDCSAGLAHLAGVGVAFYLLIGLRQHFREKGFWKHLDEPNLKEVCDLVSLGTVADVVPLINENRLMTIAGLEVLNRRGRPGISALMNVSGVKKEGLNSIDIAFKLAPRINAAGRMSHAKKAVELLLAKEREQAMDAAINLQRLNTDRQAMERSVLDDIFKKIENSRILDRRSIVMMNEDWHEGILGIAASRLADRYYRPVVLISSKGDTGKGSGRSIPGFDLYEGIGACAEYIESFGGHSMAAGIKIKTSDFNRFKEKFETVVNGMTRPESFVPKIIIDYEINFNEISDQLLDELERLQPFGASNRESLFLAKDVKVASSGIVGKKHRRMMLRQETGRAVRAIHFNIDPESDLPDYFERIAFKLHWNRWNGRKEAQIVVEEV